MLIGSPELIFILQQYLSVPFRAKLYLTEVELLVHLMGVVLDSAGAVALPLYGPCITAHLLEKGYNSSTNLYSGSFNVFNNYGSLFGCATLAPSSS